jgi:transposase
MSKVEGLWERYRKEKDCDVRERILMVIWSTEGCTSYEIGDRLNCPHSKILYWLNRYRAEGLDGLKTRPRSGKPSKLPDTEIKTIRQKLGSTNLWQTRLVRELIYRETGITYTERHVIRLLHKWGFERITPRKKHEKASDEEKESFKKRQEKYWVRYQ